MIGICQSSFLDFRKGKKLKTEGFLSNLVDQIR